MLRSLEAVVSVLGSEVKLSRRAFGNILLDYAANFVPKRLRGSFIIVSNNEIRNAWLDPNIPGCQSAELELVELLVLETEAFRGLEKLCDKAGVADCVLCLSPEPSFEAFGSMSMMERILFIFSLTARLWL